LRPPPRTSTRHKALPSPDRVLRRGRRIAVCTGSAKPEYLKRAVDLRVYLDKVKTGGRVGGRRQPAVERARPAKIKGNISEIKQVDRTRLCLNISV
jgi:hypothetical protein